MIAAPLYADVAQGPAGGQAVWLRASDGTRLRLAHWPAAGGRGTVLIFPGQAEHIEKYGPTAAHLVAAGFDVLAIDWRGQGLSDRKVTELGHVGDFAEFQQDVAVMLDHVTRAGLPRPLHLLAHSMGGCIGLRSLMNGLPVRSAVFSAPMWGLHLPPGGSLLAAPIAALASRHGAALARTPTTTRHGYVRALPFAGNRLTRDPDMYRWLQEQLEAHPDLALGGPTLGWLAAAFREMAALSRLASPALPCRIALGSAERVVSPGAIRQRHARWPGAVLDVYADAEHEVMMERPAHRDRFHSSASSFFSTA